MEKLDKPCVATLIDYDNIYVTMKEDFVIDDFKFETLPQVIRRISLNIGKINFARAYANWANRGPAIMQSFGANLINVVHVFPKENGKDRSDASIIIDAMKLLYTNKRISNFVLFSGDSDFRELALEINGMDKNITVCCFSHVLGKDLYAASDYKFIALEKELDLKRKEIKSLPDFVDYRPLIRSVARIEWQYVGWSAYRNRYLGATYPSIDWAKYGPRDEVGNKDDFLEKAIQEGIIKKGEAKDNNQIIVRTIVLNQEHPIVTETIQALKK